MRGLIDNRDYGYQVSLIGRDPIIEISGSPRIPRKLHPASSRFVDHEVDFWPGARSFWTKFNTNIGPLSGLVVEQMKVLEGRHLQCKMMKPDILVTVETLAVRLIFDLPKCHFEVAVCNECRWIVGLFAE